MAVNVNEKSDLERIAVALEGNNVDKGMIAEKSYLERIADAVENGAGGGGGSSDVFVVYFNSDSMQPSPTINNLYKDSELSESYTEADEELLVSVALNKRVVFANISGDDTILIYPTNFVSLPNRTTFVVYSGSNNFRFGYEKSANENNI